ncbi:MAG: tetratricopeptide repeat protein [Rhodospirillaceae bacterium]|nr:MAG: tetratricopeptide repeat protein [Rhodospirillaceae bacterium]
MVRDAVTAKDTGIGGKTSGTGGTPEAVGTRKSRRNGADSAAALLEKIAAQPDETIDVAEAALVLASFDHPATDLEIYREHLRELADVVAQRTDALTDTDNAGPEELAGVLTAVISGHFRYRGDEETYDDLDNANLMRVIERRKGLPVALGILYLFAARSQGWAAVGLNFPGHFLIRLESRDGRRAIIDPFHDGRILETPALRELLKVVAGQSVELDAGHYKAVSNRDILLRLQNNVKTRRLDLGMVEDALEALTRMQILNPDQPALWREAGLMHMRLGRLKHAIEAFETFVARAADGPDRQKIAQVVGELRERLH